jgi:hypothetical protein
MYVTASNPIRTAAFSFRMDTYKIRFREVGGLFIEREVSESNTVAAKRFKEYGNTGIRNYPLI